MQSLHLFGIRHHGPGSAKRLRKALHTLQPDCILVEAPMEAENAWHHTQAPGLQPPVALLLYNPKDFSQASYLPFAEFSPEWQAVQFGLQKNIPLRAMDLPMSIQLAQQEEDRQIGIRMDDDATLEQLRLIHDPLRLLARLAGYEDSERWWENTFEQEEDDTVVFRLLLDLIRELREEVGRIESPETLLREAHMRKIIRKTLKDGFSRIAVVCGAWHAPVLQDVLKIPAKTDNALLRGLPKVRVQSCWIPWSYERLAKQSGYGAGVISPAWYELIFSRRRETSIRWMSRVARLFRQKELNASSANVIEAVRLADTLAIIRGREIPSIEELEEAAVTVFSEGNTVPLELIREQLIIGTKVGKVPAHLSQLPIQKDLEQQIRSARLRKEYENAEKVRKKLDLRKPNQLLTSRLLYRLQLLGIPWGTPADKSDRALGSFSETWKLHWRPDYAIRVIEASMHGNTIEEASTVVVAHEVRQIQALGPLLELLDRVLRADLRESARDLIPKIEEVAALAKDVLQLLEAVPALVRLIRYGSTRQEDLDALEQLLEALLPRIFIGLPNSCRYLEEDPARDLLKLIIQVNSALGLLSNTVHQPDWQKCLSAICEQTETHPLLQGLATRLLFDQDKLSIQQVSDWTSLALSTANPPAQSALWLEGFLYGSALLIIHYPPLWEVLKNWVDSIPMESFYEMLPGLRRTFTRFSAAERQQLLQLAAGKIQLSAQQQTFEPDPKRTAVLLPALQQLLGRTPSGN